MKISMFKRVSSFRVEIVAAGAYVGCLTFLGLAIKHSVGNEPVQAPPLLLVSFNF